MKSVSTILLGLGLVVFAAGCGSGTVPVEGKVTKGSQPFAGGTDGDANIVLTPGTGGQSYSGKAGADGSFKIEKVPPGKYSVMVTIYPKMPTEGDKKGPSTPPVNKKLDTEWDVSSSNKSFTVDLTKLK